MTKVVNLRRERYDVYIGRGPGGKVAVKPGARGYFGNPFDAGEHGEAALEMYRDYFQKRIEEDADFRAAILGLKGKTLGCFCKPGPCHGDRIVEWLDGPGGKVR